MIKLQLEEVIGEGTMNELMDKIRLAHGHSQFYDFSEVGIALDKNNKEIYNGHTILRHYRDDMNIAFLRLCDTPEKYTAFTFKELENTEWDNEF